MTKFHLIAGAALLGLAMPATAKPAPAEPKTEAKKPAVDPMQAMTAMIALFDKFFPAGPDPDPARLAMARGTVLTMFPNGTYAEAMTGFMNKTADRILEMSEADFAAMFPEAEKKYKKSKKPSTEPLRLKLARDDPNFDAKQAAIRAFVGTTLTKLGNAAEPKFREGMARAMARKFDAAQLAEINTFLATPTGAAYGRQVVTLWFEPDVMRGALELFPEMMKLMPEVVGDAAELETQMKGKDKIPARKP